MESQPRLGSMRVTLQSYLMERTHSGKGVREDNITLVVDMRKARNELCEQCCMSVKIDKESGMHVYTFAIHDVTRVCRNISERELLDGTGDVCAKAEGYRGFIDVTVGDGSTMRVWFYMPQKNRYCTETPFGKDAPSHEVLFNSVLNGIRSEYADVNAALKKEEARAWGITES